MNDFNQNSNSETEKSKTTPVTLLGALANRLFGNKPPKSDDDGQEKEEFSEKTNKKRPVFSQSSKSALSRKPELDMKRFKTKYNTTIGNIMRNWIGITYSILFLRMNLVKFILAQFPDVSEKDKQLSQQILLESKIIYHMIKKAQHYSHEKSLLLWAQLEKLIFNRMVLKSYVDYTQGKEFSYRDWKALAGRLETMQSEFDKAQNILDALKIEKNEKQKLFGDKIQSLENLARSKEEEMEQLIEQITELKKGEMEYHQQIINSLKTCKDLNARKKQLQHMEKELKILKAERNQMVKEFSSKMKALKFDIQDKDREIKKEIGKRNKLKRALKEFGNAHPKNVSEGKVGN